MTGGVASGKSEVTRRFEARGVSVIDADLISRELVEPGQPALAEIRAHFGADVIDAQGRLDRRAMRSIVFADAQQRRALESIIHPRVRDVLRMRARDSDAALTLLAIPLLVESGDYAWVDRILVVDVPRAVQRARVMRRDGIQGAAAEAMIDAQASRTARLALATDVIVNDGSLADLDAAVARLHTRLLDLR